MLHWNSDVYDEIAVANKRFRGVADFLLRKFIEY